MVAGSVLNAMIEGSAILSGEEVDWRHLSLNYFVPYCVAGYSGARNEATKGGND
jgi:hypothetical protein